jgi:hypothetical protein
MTKPELRVVIEQKARTEAGYAIAYAILDLSDSQEATARALNRLGNGSASTDFGAIESLGMQLTAAARIVGEQIDLGASRIGLAIEEGRD